jgi:hypothetical protein
VTHSHSKDYPIKENPIKEKEREKNRERGELPPQPPRLSLGFLKFFPRGDNPNSRGKSRGSRGGEEPLS